MKTYIISFLIFCTSNFYFSQEFPTINIKDSKSNTFSTQSIIEKSFEEPVVISFWASWCVSCINELSAINDNLDDWNDEINFSLYAITIDDSRAVKKALALAKGKAWDFTILLDSNQDLKRALNIINIPYLIVIKDGEIIHTKTSYTKGSEEELFDFLKNNDSNSVIKEVSP